MKMRLHVTLINTEENAVAANLCLDIAADFTPSPTIGFSVGPWENERRPKSIGYYVDDDRFRVVFEDEHLASKQECADRAEEYSEHGGSPVGAVTDKASWGGTVVLPR